MIYIRTDANPEIASGHIMRCLSIAEAAKKLGEDSTFILADAHAIELINKKGFQHIVLGTKWNAMEDELPILINIIKKLHIQKLLIDSYVVTYDYLNCVNKEAAVFYIDDLDAFRYPVAGIICYSSCWEHFKYEKKYPNTKLFLGSQYIPLRKEFCKTKPKNYLAEKDTHSLLLMSGGSDKKNIMGSIMSKLNLKKFSQINVICGMFNDHYDRLISDYYAVDNVFIHSSTQEIHKYMKNADFAISAGGTTLFELCACGTLTTAFSIAENQIENSKILHDKGILRYSGDAAAKHLVDRIINDLELYISLPVEDKQRISDRMRNYVDGMGAYRIARELAGRSLQ